MDGLWVLYIKWMKAWDQLKLTEILQTMRSLGLFSEQSLAHYLSLVLRNKLAALLAPSMSKPVPVVQAKRKPRAMPPKRRSAGQPPRMAA
jgi:hypothetical protein